MDDARTAAREASRVRPGRSRLVGPDAASRSASLWMPPPARRVPRQPPYGTPRGTALDGIVTILDALERALAEHRTA
jgi:hypothetical protein